MLKAYTYNHFGNNAGFFPVNESSISEYYRLIQKCIVELDILASWRPEELIIKNKLSHCYRISREELPPIFHPSWMKELEGKRVLVVHPFAKSIEKQWKEHRNQIFDNPDILPNFKSLETIKAVQSIAGNKTPYNSWFDALHAMEMEISRKEFDVCLIAAGAYGMPLAAYVKSIGKIGIHVGGKLQLLFGIKGKRWDTSGLYNDFWISPLKEETPQNINRVEEGAYW